MTCEECIDFCKTFPDAAADRPFRDEDTTAVRHISNKKWFALVRTLGGRPIVNLKCEPMKADFWRSAYPDVVPAWHMNKEHWNTVFLDGAVPCADIFEMIADSHSLTLPASALK